MYRTSVHVQYRILALTREGLVSEALWDPGSDIAHLTPEGIEARTSKESGWVTLSVALEAGPVPAPAGHEFVTTLNEFTAGQAQLHVLSWGERHDPIVLPDSWVDTPLTVQWSANRVPEYWEAAAPPAEEHHVAMWQTFTAT